MPPDGDSSPISNLINRDLYEQIIHWSIVPVTLLLIWLGWYFFSIYFNPERRQERRNREIRRAVAERTALKEKMTAESEQSQNSTKS